MRRLQSIVPCILTGIGGLLAGYFGAISHRDAPDVASDGQRESSVQRAEAFPSGGKSGRSAGPGTAERPKGGLALAMKGALGHSLESKRLQKWMLLLESMGPEDGPAIASLLHEELLAGRNYGTESTAFWQTWARIDAKGAWAHLQAHQEDRGQSGTEAMFKAWSFEDPAAAMAAFAEIGESPLAGAVLAGLGHGLAESDPAAAVRFAAGLSPELQIDAAVHISGSIIHAMGNDGAQDWFDQLPVDPPTFNKEAARVLMEALSRSKPGSVEEFALARLDQPWVTRPAEQNFAASMILRNGGSPWDYVATVMEKHPRPDEPLAFATWVANLSPGSAIQWAESNPDHPATDKVLAGAVQAYVQRGSRAEAEVLLERIKEPAVREMIRLE